MVFLGLHLLGRSRWRFGLRLEVLGELGEVLARAEGLLGETLLRACVGAPQLRVEVTRSAAARALHGVVDQSGGVPLQLLERDVELMLLLSTEHAVVRVGQLAKRAEAE